MIVARVTRPLALPQGIGSWSRSFSERRPCVPGRAARYHPDQPSLRPREGRLKLSRQLLGRKLLQGVRSQLDRPSRFEYQTVSCAADRRAFMTKTDSRADSDVDLGY